MIKSSKQSHTKKTLLKECKNEIQLGKFSIATTKFDADSTLVHLWQDFQLTLKDSKKKTLLYRAIASVQFFDTLL